MSPILHSLVHMKIAALVMFVIAYTYLGIQMHNFLDKDYHHRVVGGVLWPLTFCWLVIQEGKKQPH
jgi:hypothetical protein